MTSHAAVETRKGVAGKFQRKYEKLPRTDRSWRGLGRRGCWERQRERDREKERKRARGRVVSEWADVSIV